MIDIFVFASVKHGMV